MERISLVVELDADVLARTGMHTHVYVFIPGNVSQLTYVRTVRTHDGRTSQTKTHPC